MRNEFRLVGLPAMRLGHSPRGRPLLASETSRAEPIAAASTNATQSPHRWIIRSSTRG
jgi:hypothetical protein